MTYIRIVFFVDPSEYPSVEEAELACRIEAEHLNGAPFAFMLGYKGWQVQTDEREV